MGVRLRGVLVVALIALSADAEAFINQVDGTVVPETNRMQQCLDRPGTGETMAGAVNAIEDAAVLPETFRPVFDAVSGHYRVTFVDIGEGAGFRNSFGWFWVGEDVTDPANLRTVFGCRTYGTCNCPCDTTRTITIDFDEQPGFVPGRAVGLWLRTPERLDATRENGTFPSGCPFDVGCDPTTPNANDSCGGRLDTDNRIYFTSSALNDDGDFVHFLVYESATRTDTFYFGFEDLFRGGDNDFEDMLVRATGLVPLCTPQPETCDNTDQDCDGAIDEGLTQACATTCGPGVRTCSAGSFGACSAPTPTSETCDGTDEDCDGNTDEGLSRACSNMCGSGTEICIAGSFAECSAPTPTVETCNGDDDDCDGNTDEDLTRACASTCGSGVETCVAGSFGGCTAPTPGVETCDGTDQDCDGLTDEGPITQACSTSCGVGISTCVAGSFVGCTAPTPTVETCDGTDEDCDGEIDEGITRTCSTSCGPGTETCVDGAFVGCDAPTPTAETCNNIDDDCNGIIDDGNPGGGAACLPDGMGGFELDPPTGEDERCIPGQVVCVAGELVCSGATSPTREVCNCADDDCDGEIDEDPDGTFCPGGACIDCRCLTPCMDSEFPCAPGRICDATLAPPDSGVIGYCVGGMCEGVECEEGEVCEPTTGECRDLCSTISCAEGATCIRGRCVEDNCYGRGCDAGERCAVGVCEADPCFGMGCPDGAFCSEGECVSVCETPCEAGQWCVGGSCVEAPCGGSCSGSQSCIEGECVNNLCAEDCGRGRQCVGETCVDDPCAWTRCPEGSSCRPQDGQCVDDSIVIPTVPVLGLAAGGGGCSCDAAGAPQESPWRAALALFVVVLLWRRRRAAIFACLPLFVMTSGCDVDPFCFENCGDANVDAGIDSGFDATPRDGCVVVGEEMCNGTDDDCDGLVDEEFDLQGDPRNCGGCGSECILPGAFPGCMEGECTVESCEVGFFDLDGNPTNGCEYECAVTGPEICDEVDNDCDGPVDEGFDLSVDLANCGGCGTTCTFANASATCVDGTCQQEACNAGFVDLNEDPADGCEYRCSGAGGAEVCNRIDDDCDGTVDEGFDLNADTSNCGACGRVCRFTNAVAACDAGVCTLASCSDGFEDIDSDPATGCEYECTPSGGVDDCDGRDDDCDGAVDEADPMVGTACGSATGACTQGVNSCQLGAVVCVGGVSAQSEICNDADDDCDGRTDESTVASPIPGVGDRCGATNVGACRFGTLTCTGGAFVCGGALVEPTTETCNGVDDDCNGATDDGLTTPAPSTIASCAETRGICAGRTPTCRGAGGWACDLPDGFQATESLCDTLDNDCDGSDDEGCLNPTGSDRRLDTHIAATTENSLAPAVVGDGGNRVFTAWMEVTIDGDGNAEPHIYFARSTNGGNSFSSPVRLDSAGGPAFRPSLGFAGSNEVSAAWSDFRGGTNFREIYSNHSGNNGASFDGNARVNGSGETSNRDSFGVDLAVSGNNVYVVFEAFETTRRRQVYVSRSTDGGETWSTPFQLSTPTAMAFVAATPSVAADGTNVYVVWRDNRNGSLDIFLRRSSNSGATWQGEQRIDTGDAAGSNASTAPQVAAEGANAYVVWVDDRDGGSLDIWLNRSTNSGATWLGSAVKLDQDAFPHDSIEPHVVTTGPGQGVVAWVDRRSGFPDILALRSDNAFATFSEPVRVDTGTGPGLSASGELSLAADGDLVAAAWSDDRMGMLDVFANYSLDGGVTWQPQDYRMDTSTVGTSDSQDPAVYAANGGTPRVQVIWVDHRTAAGCPSTIGMSCPNGDIYHRRLQ
ncbi:MAG: MopE-related protein [Myxococcota bacterium]